MASRLLTAPNFLRELMGEHGLWSKQEHALRGQGVAVTKILREAGFRQIRSSWLGMAVELDPDEFWAVQATYGSEERIRLGELRPEQVAQLRADFRERSLRVRAQGGRLVYRYGAMFYVTSRP